MKGESICSQGIKWYAMTDSEEKETRWTNDFQNNNNNNNNNNKSPFYFTLDENEHNFSFYSTDSEKLVHSLDAATSSNQANRFYTSAFPSWSPIASDFEMMPANSTSSLRNESKDEECVRISEKPSYSDVVAKSPVNSFCKQKSRISSTPVNDAHKRVSRHSSDSCRNKEKVEKNVNNHKWFSMEDLERDLSNVKGFNQAENVMNKSKIRGHSSPGLLNDGKTKENKENVDLKSGKSCKKSVDVENKSKIVVNQTRNWQPVTVLNEGRNRKNNHRRSVDKGVKEVSKKATVRKKRGSDARFYFDYMFLVVASHLSFCADWISHVTRWLVDLVTDVSIMSGNLCWHLFQEFCVHFSIIVRKLCNWVVEKWKSFTPWFSFTSRFSKKKKKDDDNIPLPATRDEAMRRLLSCKGKDPYSILGVSPTASEDDIKKYYKKQAFLVHPDKNRTIGAEEAFKVLAHAFDIVGDPNKRKDYDSKRQEAEQLEETWNEFADLLSQLQEKMDEVANTIKCTNCKRRHRRIKVDRPRYSARFCKPCKIMHAAREGDIWAETKILGFLWHYYACMDGAVYDVTEWAACQAKNLKHLRANTHTVQYRIISSSKQNSSSFESSPSESNYEDMFKNFQKKTSNSSAKTDSNSNSKKKKNKKK